MTEKHSSAKEQYKSLEQIIDATKEEFGSAIASGILKIPMGISYEVWKYLHELKGDWID